MAPQSILKCTRARAIKGHFHHPTCSCSQEMAREKVQLRFFLRQLKQNFGANALTDMFKEFYIPVSAICNLFEADVHTYLVSTNNANIFPKDAQGKPFRTVVPSELIIVKDEVVKDEKKILKKVDFKKTGEPKERIFIDLTLDG